MKKEFKINITKSKGSTDELLLICVSLNEFLIGVFSMTKNGLCVLPREDVSDLLGVYHGDFHGYLSIPEIKKLHDEHFKKEVDLFEFLRVGKVFYYVDRNVLVVPTVYCKLHDDLFNSMKAFYNVFPTEELAEKARSMSLDERKQLLFANAKGYEVLTREETIENYNDVFVVYYDRIFRIWLITNSGIDCTYNIYFVTLEHAQECADFMNETNEVSE